MTKTFEESETCEAASVQGCQRIIDDGFVFVQNIQELCFFACSNHLMDRDRLTCF